MMNGLPNILVLSNNNLLRNFDPKTTKGLGEGFSQTFNIHYLKYYPKRLQTFLARHKVDLILAEHTLEDQIDLTGDLRSKVLFINPFDMLHLLEGDYVFEQYIKHALDNKKKRISVFTPTYNTGELILDTYVSLYSQTFTDWEWVIIDDSTDDVTYDILKEIADNDYRVRVFKESKHSGVIGYLKNRAANLCLGDILVELDHDDLLRNDALSVIDKAFSFNPFSGYLYSDTVEFYADGRSRTYGEGFGMGCGKYYQTKYLNKSWIATSVPLNSKTLRHNVGLPNHVRAWRSSFYHEIGGHNVNLAIADDHELSIRSFLARPEEVIHVNAPLYFQRVRDDGQNTTNTRNAEIQRTSRGIFDYYDTKIHYAIVDMNKEDLVWDPINNKSDLSKSIDIEENYSINYNL